MRNHHGLRKSKSNHHHPSALVSITQLNFNPSCPPSLYPCFPPSSPCPTLCSPLLLSLQAHRAARDAGSTVIHHRPAPLRLLREGVHLLEMH